MAIISKDYFLVDFKKFHKIMKEKHKLATAKAIAEATAINPSTYATWVATSKVPAYFTMLIEAKFGIPASEYEKTDVQPVNVGIEHSELLNELKHLNERLENVEKVLVDRINKADKDTGIILQHLAWINNNLVLQCKAMSVK